MAGSDYVARLYAVAPAEFTAARNRMAAELRQSGRIAEARAVSRLRKPSAALWAVNRLASTDRKGLVSFVDAVERLRRSQLRDPRASAEALRDQRAALDALVGGARDVLARSGLTASQAIVRRISNTLMGAAIDRGHAAALRRGQLTEELAAPGFEAFSGARVSGARLRLVPPPTPRVASSGQENAAARENVRAVEAERQRRVREAADLEREATDRRRSVEQLEAESAEARGKVAEVQKRLRAAREAARTATAAASRARRRPPR
jgi:hypothetical protein